MAESIRKMQLQVKAMSIEKMTEKEVKEKEKRLEELKEYAEKQGPELGKTSEMMLSMQNHFCNIGLKLALKGPNKGIQRKNPKTGMVHLLKTSQDIVDFNEASQTTLIEQNKINPETEEQRAIREKENAEVIKKCKEKAERRKYHELTGKIAGFDNQEMMEKRHNKQETQFTLTFGFGFITLMFLGFVSGYFLGRRIFGLDPLPSIFVSLFVGIVTLLVEMVLMIFRIQKLEKIQAADRKRLKIE